MAYTTPPMANAVRLRGRLVAELVGNPEPAAGVPSGELPSSLPACSTLRRMRLLAGRQQAPALSARSSPSAPARRGSAGGRWAARSATCGDIPDRVSQCANGGGYAGVVIFGSLSAAVLAASRVGVSLGRHYRQRTGTRTAAARPALRARADERMRVLNQPDLVARKAPEHRLSDKETRSVFFMWDPSAAVSRQLRPSASANGQRRPPVVGARRSGTCGLRPHVAYRFCYWQLPFHLSILEGICGGRPAGGTEGACWRGRSGERPRAVLWWAELAGVRRRGRRPCGNRRSGSARRPGRRGAAFAAAGATSAGGAFSEPTAPSRVRAKRMRPSQAWPVSLLALGAGPGRLPAPRQGPGRPEPVGTHRRLTGRGLRRLERGRSVFWPTLCRSPPPLQGVRRVHGPVSSPPPSAFAGGLRADRAAFHRSGPCVASQHPEPVGRPGPHTRRPARLFPAGLHHDSLALPLSVSPCCDIEVLLREVGAISVWPP